ncbi:MAG: DUF445 family protein [Pseudomonadota bacterium]|nr:DUF445 family protein [Pseudomonadota bacterium]
MLALSLFGAAALLFVITLFLPPTWTVGLIKAFAEAAMVGALADWFAVVALFRRIPIPLVSRHTEIIPKNKIKIADNLALFVREKFLDTESIVALIRRHDPAKVAAEWLVLPQNAARLGDYLVKMAAWALDFVEDTAVQRFIGKAVHGVIRSVDFSQSAGMLLDGLTQNRRHQELLNAGIGQLSHLLENEETQQYLAQGIGDWLREDYAFLEKMLPTDTIGRKGAAVAVRMAANILARVTEDPDHPLRQRFDSYTEEFVGRLKSDPAFLAKGEEVKRYLIEDDTLNGYVRSIWGDLKTWLKNDLHSDDSVLRQRIVASGGWVGKTLAEDPVLRQSLNDNMESAARAVAPEFAGFLTSHIADTVKKWDDREMSDQIELNIGKDLQFIRINGTIVGGMIGVVLYLLAQLPALIH